MLRYTSWREIGSVEMADGNVLNGALLERVDYRLPFEGPLEDQENETEDEENRDAEERRHEPTRAGGPMGMGSCGRWRCGERIDMSHSQKTVASGSAFLEGAPVEVTRASLKSFFSLPSLT